MQRGIFITLEGIEASGKSTQQKLIAEFLSAHNIEFITTREPGGTLLGEELRNLLLNFNKEEISPVTEALLMFAARNQHVTQLIEPALNAGKWVICDRFVDSSYAYQGGGRGLDLSTIAELEKISLSGLTPDITFYFATDWQTSQNRQRGRGNTKDRFEKKDAKFFAKVEAVFAQRAKQLNRIKTIDSRTSVEQISAQVFSHLQKFLSTSKML